MTAPPIMRNCAVLDVACAGCRRTALYPGGLTLISTWVGAHILTVRTKRNVPACAS